MKFSSYMLLASVALLSDSSYSVEGAIVKTGGLCTLKNIKSTSEKILSLLDDFWLTSDTCLEETDCCGQMVMLNNDNPTTA